MITVFGFPEEVQTAAWFVSPAWWITGGVIGPCNYLNKTLSEWTGLVLFFQGKKFLKFWYLALPPSFSGVLLCALNIGCCIFYSSVKSFIILNTGCHLNRVTHWYWWITNFRPSRGNICKFCLHTYIWHLSSSLLTSASYLDCYVFTSGPCVLELQRWKWAYWCSI